MQATRRNLNIQQRGVQTAPNVLHSPILPCDHGLLNAHFQANAGSKNMQVMIFERPDVHKVKSIGKNIQIP